MTLKYEKSKLSQSYQKIIGCDEVGRGSLAGPVVAAAVILDVDKPLPWFSEVRDSKELTPRKRQELAKKIRKHALGFAIAKVSEKIIDKINIHNASLLAMKKAVTGLRLTEKASSFIFVDGKFLIPNLAISQEAVIAGDSKVLSIAAASIMAKIYRDNLMRKVHLDYPIYNFVQHKGYATLYHRKMIIKNGLSQAHRKTFCTNLKIV
jgi:ribonuclease HII